MKDCGQIMLSELINVGSIDEEILKKGLELSDLLYLNSMPSVSLKAPEESGCRLSLDYYSVFFKN